MQLIELITQAGIRRFVLSSTAAVFISSDEPLSEDSPLGPKNVYGYSKLAVEQVLDWYRQIHGCILRLCDISTPPAPCPTR